MDLDVSTVKPGISKLFQKHKKFTIARSLQGLPYILERFSSFLSFYHLSNGTIEQIIYQMKALI